MWSSDFSEQRALETDVTVRGRMTREQLGRPYVFAFADIASSPYLGTSAVGDPVR